MRVPDIFFPEVSNAVLKRVRRGEIREQDARDLVMTLRRHRIKSFLSRPLIPRAMELCRAGPLVIYDALYVALAEELRCPLVSADEPMIRAARVAQTSAELRTLEA